MMNGEKAIGNSIATTNEVFGNFCQHKSANTLFGIMFMIMTYKCYQVHVAKTKLQTMLPPLNKFFRQKAFRCHASTTINHYF